MLRFYYKYTMTTGLMNLLHFNYETYDKKIPLSLSDRIGYSFLAYLFGNISIPNKIINYKYIENKYKHPYEYIFE